MMSPRARHGKKGFSMKNTIKLFGIIAVVAVIGLSFAACGDGAGGGGGGGTTATVSGTYTATTEEDTASLTFKSGGAVDFVGPDSTETGTYTVSGSTITMTFGGEKLTATIIDSKNITFMGLTFTKS
jgi:hypothetical protein